MQDVCEGAKQTKQNLKIKKNKQLLTKEKNIQEEKSHKKRKKQFWHRLDARGGRRRQKTQNQQQKAKKRKNKKNVPQARCERWEKEAAATNAGADQLEEQVIRQHYSLSICS